MSVTSPNKLGLVKKILGFSTKPTGKNESEQEPMASIHIHLVDDTSINLDINQLKRKYKGGDLLVMDVVKEVCKTQNIYPRSSGFFGLKIENQPAGIHTKDMWMIQIKKFDSYEFNSKKQKLQFRLQFKYLESKELRNRDEEAYKYYLKQCRQDFKSGLFVNHLRENEKDLLRMVILEMMIIAKEEKTISNVKDLLKNKNRKLFNMEEILRKHQGRDIARSKEKVENSLPLFEKVTEPDQDFLTEIELLKNYRDERFFLNKYEGTREKPDPIELWITPRDVSKKVVTSHRFTIWQAEYRQFHKLEIEFENKERGWKMMIVRGTEPPELVYCKSKEDCESICSFMDGYCRLLVDQYDSILQDLIGQYLSNKFYHGPIEREVVPKILQSKGRLPGNYLLREHTKVYDWYVLSLIKDDGNFSHIEIQYVGIEDQMVYKLNDNRTFATIDEMIEYYKDEAHKNELKATLKTLIQPKGYNAKVPFYQDPSTFRPEPPLFVPLEDNTSLANSVINQYNMEVIKKGTFGDIKKSQCIDGRQYIFKKYDSLTPQMLEDISSTLSLLHHPHILKFFPQQFYHDLYLAFEYLPEGPLDKFIENHRETIKYGDLLRYHNQISDAVKFLHQNGLIHADLRLSNVYLKDLQCIKLANACITWKLVRFQKLNERVYNKRYTHLAPEILLHYASEFSRETDIWAYGLTIWEMYSGQKPFGKFAQDQLTQYMKKQMDLRSVNDPALIHLNMYCLPYCSEELFKFFSGVLHMYPQSRWNMNDIVAKVDEMSKRAPSKLKQKHYFVDEWPPEEKIEKRNVEPEDSDYVLEGEPTSLHEEGNHIMKDHSALESRIEGMELDEKEKEKLFIERNIKQESMNKEEQNNIENDEKEIMDMDENDKEELKKIELRKIKSSLLKPGLSDRKQSHSAPSSPVHHKFKRTNSVDDKSKHMKEDIEMASILVGMSQTAQVPKKKDSLTTAEHNIASHIRNKILNGNHPTIKPQPKNSIPSNRLPSYKKFTKITTPPKPPPPPDSPEGVRKDFPDQPRKEIPANEKTRMFLKEYINKERDRFRGKRTSSYQDEMDEFRSNTKRAAKRAAFGPNAFNIETKMPTNLFLNTQPLLKPLPSLQPPKDCMNFFSKVAAEEKSKISSSAVTIHSYLDPYRTISELRNSGILSSPIVEPYKTPAQIRSEINKKYNENEKFISSNSEKENSIEQSKAHIAATSVATSLRFPYGYTTSTSNPSTPSSTFSHDVNKPTPRKLKEERISLDNLTSQSTKIHLPMDQSSSRSSSIGVPLLINSQYVPTGYVAAPGYTIRSGPPNLPRAVKPNILPSSPVILSQHISTGSPVIYRPAATVSVPGGTHIRIIAPPRSVGTSSYPTIRSVIPIATKGSSVIMKPEDKGPFSYISRPEIPIQPSNIVDEPPKGHVLYREIKRSDLSYKEEDLLGKGNFGKVYRGFWNYKDHSKVSHKIPVAIKKLLPPEKEVSDEFFKAFEKEAKALANLQESINSEYAVHIIKLFGVCQDSRQFMIVTELLEKGSLEKYVLDQKAHLKEGDLLYYAKQISQGMDYLHLKGYLHRDLSCRNVLVKTHALVKISDFGLSRSLLDKGYYRASVREQLPIRWMSLESLNYGKYTFQNDYWAYGVTLWELFTLYHPNITKVVTPYEEISDRDLSKELETGVRLQKPDKCPMKLWTMIEKCWDKNPDKRPVWMNFQKLLKEMLEVMSYVL